ncbi:putative MFS transporter [Talaromyces proteolyticus]|uniref:MFS transporter n=1 Tax=Talaromyces proteolyticus TaxID=1131652 RepID=A0AAD4Q328_9EURO|nr:putative MFS transporter [Talaromyces proteolyticus]KAH8701002.1 putative MFS transporter [Talaromyces proteolyticus]
MAPPRQPLFTASRLQSATYLLGVCPFSIAFLVFLNSSVSFVVSDVIGLESGEGDAIGTLGFADELLALVACPVWGLLSDKIGVRYVCTAGYAIIALSLVLFVQASNVYPQLLLGRLLFSLGGSAVSTMVTAVLPTVTESNNKSNQQRRSHHIWRASLSSEVTITPSRFERRLSRQAEAEQTASSSSRLAGFVGMFAGCGALIALAVFLPLPARFEKYGSSPADAVKQSYYIVSLVALIISIVCFFGLRNLPGEQGKHLRSLWTPPSEAVESNGSQPSSSVNHLNLLYAFSLSFKQPDILLGYVGGFVARASSVGISLFIPLFVNHYYRNSDLCSNPGSDVISRRDLGDIKKSCPEAYILASILTGVSQLIALLCAPAFGYLSEKSRRSNFPLLFATIAGITGYVAFPLLPSPQFKGPNGNGGVFLIMSLIGISQIGAIVCSLGILSNGVLSINPQPSHERPSLQVPNPSEDETHSAPQGEHEPLLSKPGSSLATNNLNHLKGAIAGIYSLYGGAGILILTKLGGLLFDVLSSGSPFYIMAIFNGMLLVSGIACGLWRYQRMSA